VVVGPTAERDDMSNHVPYNIHVGTPEEREKLSGNIIRYRSILTSGMPGVTMPARDVLNHALETAIHYSSNGATVNDPQTQPTTDG